MTSFIKLKKLMTVSTVTCETCTTSTHIMSFVLDSEMGQ